VSTQPLSYSIKMDNEQSNVDPEPTVDADESDHEEYPVVSSWLIAFIQECPVKVALVLIAFSFDEKMLMVFWHKNFKYTVYLFGVCGSWNSYVNILHIVNFSVLCEWNCYKHNFKRLLFWSNLLLSSILDKLCFVLYAREI